MNTSKILNRLKSKPELGLQLSKRNGLLSSTWLIYMKNDFYYYFDISEKITFDEKHKYSEKQFLDQFETSYFEIDCECN